MSELISPFFESLESRALLSASPLSGHAPGHENTAPRMTPLHVALHASRTAKDKETKDTETSTGTDTDIKVADPEEAGTDAKDLVDGPKDKAGKSVLSAVASSVLTHVPISPGTHGALKARAKIAASTDPSGGPDGVNVDGGPGGADDGSGASTNSEPVVSEASSTSD